ncbi:two-component system, chemotaxis family, sensor kinase CheA [Pseudooceanicola antarcticus]|uniref:Chemotaxis protein CheA n=1 Tax=Pseudooceanicola antarcticus TaxID=1247613 RepID=A0A285IZE5_9RHOB|nr:chemotaxis protein CheA [Pseudooceanicola antarcticus]PJE25886.1 chemotaxis protein CheA [Pseudooceanicola antarcticus]SNY52476.1 two-component system, chemotaxis family, sensor kinase CheA [Pseudooceanicola antarcticus]
MSDQNDPMAEIRASFFIECEELMEALQDGLQELDDGSEEPETINVVFRAVHSIKGGAGAFGLEALVRFAHRYETVLDEVRNGSLQPDSEAMKLFFLAADHLSDLVRACRDETELDEATSDELLTRLDALLGEDGGSEEVEPEEFEVQGLSLALDLPDLDVDDTEANDSTLYTVRFKPEQELFATGNEPLMLLRNLCDLGEATVRCNFDDLPSLTDLAPETPYVEWIIELKTEAAEPEIRDIFEFVDGLCELEITGPQGEAAAPAPDAPAEEPPAPPEPAAEAADPAPAPEPPANVVPMGNKEPPAPETAKEPEAEKKPATPAAKSVVRVDLERIERLVNLVGELVINQAMLSQSLDEAGLSPHSDAMNGLEEFQRLTRDIQDSVMMIRAQPVKSLFQRMSRIVRESSAAVEKEVRLVTEGEATEVDKTVIERLADPLTHMIRNAVDHGLEATEKREELGKSRAGTVTLTAAHRSGRVIIEVADDGAGINRKRVQEIAANKGLISPDAQLSDSEIDNLLFLPGFSTAKQVSNLSGRGVGMDVVKTSIQSLGGRITINSEPGKGTTFSISLPLTLAVLDGMVVNVAEETLVLPLNVVVETLSLGPDDVQMLRPGNYVVRWRGGFVPLYDLGVMLGYRSHRKTDPGSIVLLIVLEDGSRAALVIDGIQDQRQVVIKGLDDSFYRAPGIAAATILGDGQIALILDPADVISGMGHIRGTDLMLSERKIANE